MEHNHLMFFYKPHNLCYSENPYNTSQNMCNPLSFKTIIYLSSTAVSQLQSLHKFPLGSSGFFLLNLPLQLIWVCMVHYDVVVSH